MSFLHPQAGGTDPATQGDTADAPLTWDPNHWAEGPQRWWKEWLEAGQLWSSWWLSQLPPVGWPPIGSALPPEPMSPLRRPSSSTAATELRGVENAPPRTSRARATRHT
ncbi:MAG: hypothetical protein ABI574_16945 [Burkholderiales bacterium]